MNDTPYNNRELDFKFGSLEEKISENHAEILDYLGDIKEQTTKTNGRVSSLETLRVGAYIASGLISIIVALVVYVYFQDKKALEDKIEAAKQIIELKKTTK